jgi:hypothetical protein
MQIDQLLSQYFQFFHASHPCVLPLRTLRVHLTNEPVASKVLLPVLLFIGSVFTDTVDTKPLSLAAQQAIDSTRVQEGALSPFYIQAILLYSIAVYASNEPEKTQGLLNEAIHVALKLGMHQAEFASIYGQMDPVLEESWRRTWWMIYTTDAHIAGSLHTYPTQTGGVQITTELPCEEQQYESGVRISKLHHGFNQLTHSQNIPPPATLRSYGVREFSDTEFSSFAQFIGFTQGLNRALATRRIDDIESVKVTAKSADIAMTAWCSLLPTSKRRVLREDGRVDELLFKANIMMHTYVLTQLLL